MPFLSAMQHRNCYFCMTLEEGKIDHFPRLQPNVKNTMRKIILALCLLQFGLSYGQDADPVLFKVGNDEGRVSEFQYIYEKNNADKADYSAASINEYLDLYKIFKLKVHKARLNGLDTIKSLQKELEGYRKQLANSYLKDKEISSRLVNEVFERSKKDIEVSHIFIAAEPKAPSEKVLDAENKINDIHSKLKRNGGKGFGDMAKTLSEDKVSSKKDGYLGYYTAPLPDGFYQFENAMYNTKKGEFSEPFKSKMGYHIIKVTDVRDARGEMEIAHILLRKSEKGKLRVNAAEKSDSVYKLLKAGKTFEALAKDFSDDTKTNTRGGYLGFFGVNQYEKIFEDTAFGLKNNGDFSTPVETKLGYHIIKRISMRDNSDETRARKRIEARINNNDRFTIAQEKLLEDVMKEAKFKEDRSALSDFVSKTDQQFYSYKWEAPAFAQKTLFNLGDKNYDLKSFGDWSKSNVRERLKFSKSKPIAEAVYSMYEMYVKESVMSYEEANLERKYPDFKALMREYREGILLFEITKNEVWDKASQDTLGLKDFYEQNRDNYKWAPRANVTKVNIEAKTPKDLEEAFGYAKKKGINKFLNKYAAKEGFKITKAEEILETMAPEIRGLSNKAGSITELTTDLNQGHFYVYQSGIDPSYKTLKEARGYAIADYQDHLEKKWVAQLMKDHPVELDKGTLKSLIK